MKDEKIPPHIAPGIDTCFYDTNKETQDDKYPFLNADDK